MVVNDAVILFRVDDAIKKTDKGFRVNVNFGPTKLRNSQHPSSVINQWAFTKKLNIKYKFSREGVKSICKIVLARYIISEGVNSNKDAACKVACERLVTFVNNMGVLDPNLYVTKSEILKDYISRLNLIPRY